MKKRYEKPMVLFEDFSMSTNIAGSCDVDTNVQQENVCGIPTSTPGMVLFIEGISGCLIEVVDGSGNIDGVEFCYNVPTDDKNLFNS